MQVDIEKIIPVTEARDKFNKVVDEVEDSDEIYVFTKNGKPSAVMVGVNHLEKLTGETHGDITAKIAESPSTADPTSADNSQPTPAEPAPTPAPAESPTPVEDPFVTTPFETSANEPVSAPDNTPTTPAPAPTTPPPTPDTTGPKPIENTPETSIGTEPAPAPNNAPTENAAQESDPFAMPEEPPAPQE